MVKINGQCQRILACLSDCWFTDLEVPDKAGVTVLCLNSLLEIYLYKFPLCMLN